MKIVSPRLLPRLVIACAALLSPIAMAATETVLHRFDPSSEGTGPGNLRAAADGTIYGTLQRPTEGVIFRRSTSGAVDVIATVPGHWVSALALAGDGTLYGLGRNIDGTSSDYLFRVAPPGVDILYTFPQNGNFPNSAGYALIAAANGRLYGTTDIGNGTVFRFNPVTLAYTTMHTFNGDDGFSPVDLAQAPNGTIYGTTAFARTHGGIVYKLLSGGGIQILNAPGDVPGNLIFGTDGSIYGTLSAPILSDTPDGGDVFKLTPSGTFSVLHHFDVSVSPRGLVRGADGQIYGVTGNDGAVDAGTVFRIHPQSGAFARLHTFGVDPADGRRPSSRLLAIDGGIVGATSSVPTLFRLDQLSDDLVNIEPSAASLFVYLQQCIHVAVLDGATNAPRPGVTLSLVRTGTNPATTSITTDATGDASHCWRSLKGGLDRVTATTGAISDVALITWKLRPVDLTATGMINVVLAKPLADKVTLTLDPAAQMLDSISDKPLANKLIRFMAGDTALCNATTDAQGHATCSVTLVQNAATAINLGYEAYFDGGTVYEATVAEGELVCAGAGCR